MTAQEQQMLQGLTDRINQTQLPEKDTDAEQMLQQALKSNPDALYVLAQTVLVQQYALEQAQRQLAEQKTQMEQMRQQQASLPPPQKHATSFLGNLLGLKDDEPARPAPPPPAAPAYAPVPYTPAPGYASPPGYAPGYAPGYGAPMYAQPGFGAAPQGGGFLRSAMQTAAGVAAGALAFEGVESLMHGFGHAAGYGSEFGSGMGGGFGGFGGGGRPEEVINNYYGDAVPGAEHGLHTDKSDFLSSGSGLSGIGSGLGTGGSETLHLDSASAFSSPTFKDADYRPGQDSGSDLSAGGYDAGAGYTDSGSSDTGATEDAAVDESSVDDSASFDDSSSADTDFDSGGDSGGGFDSGGSDDGGNF
jgi:hypothetical protein